MRVAAGGKAATPGTRVRYRVCAHAVPSCWMPPSALVSGAARLIKSTLHSNHGQEQNSSGLSHEKCRGAAALSLGPCAGAVCVRLQPFDVVH